jgi:hypothetical protein
MDTVICVCLVLGSIAVKLSAKVTRRAAGLAALAAIASFGCARPPPPAGAAPAPPPPPLLPLRVLDAAAPNDDVLLYADGARLRDELLRELIDAVGSVRVDLQVELHGYESKCGFQPLLVADEMFTGLRWERALPSFAIVLRIQRTLDDAARCLKALVPDAQEVLFDGRRSWQVPGAFVTSARTDLLIIATSAAEARARVQLMERAALSSSPSHSEFRGALLAAEMHANNPFGVASGTVRWEPAASGTHLTARATFREDGTARSLERVLKEGLLQALGSSASMEPGLHDVGSALVQGTTVTRTGSELAIDMKAPSLRGQGGVVARMTSLVVRGARHYVAAARMAEARDAVYKIARALADVVELQRKLGQRMRFPSSAPLVPNDVPYGKPVKVSTESFSHPSWKAIGYSAEGDVYYATDFVTAPDGKSVVVRARGDIDRDGVTSLFELDVRIDPHGTVFIGPIIRERDAEE